MWYHFFLVEAGLLALDFGPPGDMARPILFLGDDSELCVVGLEEF